MRSLIPETCPVMVLTATSTEKVYMDVVKTLLLHTEDVKTVAVVPDRYISFWTLS